MVRFQRCVAVSAAALGLWGAAMGCGDSEKADSFDSISKEIAKPTGTVSQTTVAKIGEKFEAASTSTVGGMREDDQVGQNGSATVSVDCPSGGKYTVTGSGSQSSGRATAKFDDCCYAAGCCTSGTGNMYYSTEQGADYNYCASYDMDSTCGGASASVEYSGCFSLSGKAIILIDVDGESFAVSGSRSNGTGTLEIKGANGTWSCTFTSGSGSCSSSGGGSFSFTKG